MLQGGAWGGGRRQKGCCCGLVMIAMGTTVFMTGIFLHPMEQLGTLMIVIGLFLAVIGIVLMMVFICCRKNMASNAEPGQSSQPIITGVPPPQQGASNYNPVPSGGYQTQQPYPGPVQAGPQPGYPSAGAQPGYPPPQAAGYQIGGYPPPQPAYPLQPPYPGGQPSAPSMGDITLDETCGPPPSYYEVVNK